MRADYWKLWIWQDCLSERCLLLVNLVHKQFTNITLQLYENLLDKYSGMFGHILFFSYPTTGIQTINCKNVHLVYPCLKFAVVNSIRSFWLYNLVIIILMHFTLCLVNAIIIYSPCLMNHANIYKYIIIFNFYSINKYTIINLNLYWNYSRTHFIACGASTVNLVLIHLKVLKSIFYPFHNEFLTFTFKLVRHDHISNAVNSIMYK